MRTHFHTFLGAWRIWAPSLTLVLPTVLGGTVAMAPGATASVLNSCPKTVAVTARNASTDKVTVTVTATDPACYGPSLQPPSADPPFVGEFISLRLSSGAYQAIENIVVTKEGEGITGAAGQAEISFSHSATDTIYARACAIHPEVPDGENYYCAESPPS